MNCKYCDVQCINKGFYVNEQKYYCKGCKKYQRNCYKYNLFSSTYDSNIVLLSNESMSINSISRYLKLSKTTVRRRIGKIGNSISVPLLKENKNTYEIDEMHVLVGNKEASKKIYLTYALNRRTKSIVDFIIGSRTKETIKVVTDKVLALNPGRIYTDGLNVYPVLIPSGIHKCFKYRTNKIERNNLALRNSLKRLSRKTICFSKSKAMLESCLKIYFWGLS